MTEAELKKDWLASNGVITFVSALLLAQQWQSTDAVYELPFNLTFPALSDPSTFMLASFLFILSLLFTLASIIPTKWIPSWVIPVASVVSPSLGILASLIFGYTWIAIFLKLPSDQWWTAAFVLGGLVIFLALMYRSLRAWFGTLLSIKPSNGGKSGDVVDD